MVVLVLGNPLLGLSIGLYCSPRYNHSWFNVSAGLEGLFASLAFTNWDKALKNKLSSSD